MQSVGADTVGKCTKGTYSGRTPYQLATNGAVDAYHVYAFEQVAQGNAAAVQRLLAGGVQADLKDCSPLADSLLHWACSFRQLEVAALLIEYGASPNVVNANGQTPLHALALTGSGGNSEMGPNREAFVNIATLLVDEGADPAIVDLSGKTALQIANNGRSDLQEAIKSVVGTL